jgi:DNA-binding beta-propeller fold protein YncE
MRLLVLTFLLLPSMATAQIEGIALAFKHDVPVPPDLARPGLSIGDSIVAVYPDVNANWGLQCFRFDGTKASSLQTSATHSVAFAGEHLYVGNEAGIEVFDKDGKKIQSLPQGMNRSYLAATPDGSTVFATQNHAPASLAVFERDRTTGKLTQAQLFQTDDTGLTLAKATKPGVPIPIDRSAVRLPLFDGPAGMFTDGNRFFVACHYSHSIVMFAKSAGRWTHLLSLEETKTGPIRNGIVGCQAVTANEQGDVFVGGRQRLCWLRLSGENLDSKQWWTDDSEAGATPEVSWPCVGDVRALAFSKNGEYLFVASTDVEGVSVFEVGTALKLIGTLKDSPAGAKTWNVAVSHDGKKLFAKTSACSLVIYDLSEKFTR